MEQDKKRNQWQRIGNRRITCLLSPPPPHPHPHAFKQKWINSNVIPADDYGGSYLVAPAAAFSLIYRRRTALPFGLRRC